ncbi:MAG: hypothetical protein ACLUYV_01515 [Alistipes shahii]
MNVPSATSFTVLPSSQSLTRSLRATPRSIVDSKSSARPSAS